MTSHRVIHDRPIRNSESAAVRAYDELRDAGCEGLSVDVPYETRGTWIVTARCDDCEVDRWRVHIDRQSGATRIVGTVE